MKYSNIKVGDYISIHNSSNLYEVISIDIIRICEQNIIKTKVLNNSCKDPEVYFWMSEARIDIFNPPFRLSDYVILKGEKCMKLGKIMNVLKVREEIIYGILIEGKKKIGSSKYLELLRF